MIVETETYRLTLRKYTIISCINLQAGCKLTPKKPIAEQRTISYAKVRKFKKPYPFVRGYIQQTKREHSSLGKEKDEANDVKTGT